MYAIYYDARLSEVSDAGVLVLDYQGRRLELPTFTPIRDYSHREVGKIGVAQYVPESKCWRFNAYLDQSLRRIFELDDARRLGWRNDSQNEVRPNGWTAPRGIVPGEDGCFIDDDTEPVTIDVPEDFFALCEQFNHTAEAVLRGFIADACGLMNYVREPRGDHYSSNGSDERMMAQDYLERAYAPFRGAQTMVVR